MSDGGVKYASASLTAKVDRFSLVSLAVVTSVSGWDQWATVNTADKS
jgi:hypothetical protein